jgi:DNA-binding transcriptional LysR family regulator
MKESLIIRGSALAQLPLFLAVAELRSFTAAARRLRLSTSAASQAIARLEAELGVTLLNRTTRSVNVTEAGARLLEEVAPALRAASAALVNATTERQGLSGSLRLNVPRIACRVGLPALLAEYARRHPEVRVEVEVDDRRVDIVKEGFDAGIRARASIHKDMIEMRLTPPIRFAVVGSKRYFARRPKPKHPRDLVHHACLGWRSLGGDAEYRWEFSEKGRDLEVAVRGPLISNDTELLVACAERDLGLAFVVESEARRELEAGALETALDDYATSVDGLFLYFPTSARGAPKLRALVDCARDASMAQKAANARVRSKRKK